MRLSHQAVEEVKLKGERSEKFLQVENFFCMGNRSRLQPTLFSIYRLAPHTREGEKFSQSLTPRHLGTRSIRVSTFVSYYVIVLMSLLCVIRHFVLDGWIANLLCIVVVESECILIIRQLSFR